MPLGIQCSFAASIPRARSVRMNASVRHTIAVASRYIRSSRRSRSRSASDRFIAPTAGIDSGHRSRSSKTHGVRRTRVYSHVATAQKNCGEVPTATSKRPSRQARHTAVGTNDR